MPLPPWKLLTPILGSPQTLPPEIHPPHSAPSGEPPIPSHLLPPIGIPPTVPLFLRDPPQPASPSGDPLL